MNRVFNPILKYISRLDPADILVIIFLSSLYSFLLGVIHGFYKAGGWS